jgi:chitin synthase
LTTSVEDGSFGLQGISYFNAFIQFILTAMVIGCFLIAMGNKPKAYVFLVCLHHTILTSSNRAHVKYKAITIIFGVLMVYLLFTSVVCAMEALKQGGTANSVMLFSVLITFGCKPLSTHVTFSD